MGVFVPCERPPISHPNSLWMGFPDRGRVTSHGKAVQHVRFFPSSLSTAGVARVVIGPAVTMRLASECETFLRPRLTVTDVTVPARLDCVLADRRHHRHHQRRRRRLLPRLHTEGWTCPPTPATTGGGGGGCSRGSAARGGRSPPPPLPPAAAAAAAPTAPWRGMDVPRYSRRQRQRPPPPPTRLTRCGALGTAVAAEHGGSRRESASARSGAARSRPLGTLGTVWACEQN